jgi:hypothetical protein
MCACVRACMCVSLARPENDGLKLEHSVSLLAKQVNYCCRVCGFFTTKSATDVVSLVFTVLFGAYFVSKWEVQPTVA